MGSPQWSDLGMFMQSVMLLAAERGLDAVAVHGGDGTVSEAADGLAHTPTALLPLPAGVTNVFARLLAGNVPVELIKNTRIPVLILPPDWSRTV